MKPMKLKKVSPVGNVKWFKFIQPDQKFKKYSADLIVEDSEELQKLISELNEMVEKTLEDNKEELKPAQKKKAKKSEYFPIEEELDGDGNATGKYVMKFRAKSEGVRKDDTVYYTQPPMVFKKDGKPYSGEEKKSLQVPNGSEIKVAFNAQSYFVKNEAGVSLKPTAALLFKLEQMNSATDFGFSQDEFEQSDESDHEDFSSQEESEDNDSDF